MKILKSNQQRGFTLMELIVAIGVFSVAVSIIVGIFLSATRVERRILATVTIIDNTRFVFERMGKEIRTGKSFSLPNGNGSGKLCFTNDKNKAVVYQLSGTALLRFESACASAPPANSEITSSAVTVAYLFFYLSGEAPPPDTNQPRITITAGFRPSSVLNADSVINIQKTISPIPLDA